jgi:RNA polymerase sigma-70 factor, ECF subfamily
VKNLAAIESESMLIDLARTGCVEAFAALILKHNPRVYRVSLKLLRNREDAEDNLQNTMFKAFQRIKQFNKQSQFSTWLVRIAINEALMFLRKPERLKTQNLPDDITEEFKPRWEFSDRGVDPEREYMRKELVLKTMEDLPLNLKTIFVLHKLEGWTNAEMAKEFGLPCRRLKGRVFRARTLLRKKLTTLSAPKIRPEPSVSQISAL